MFKRLWWNNQIIGPQSALSQPVLLLLPVSVLYSSFRAAVQRPVVTTGATRLWCADLMPGTALAVFQTLFHCHSSPAKELFSPLLQLRKRRPGAREGVHAPIAGERPSQKPGWNSTPCALLCLGP